MLTKCVNCGFYVRPADEFCLNCGFHNPTVPFKVDSLRTGRIVLLSALLAGLILLINFYFDSARIVDRLPQIFAIILLCIMIVATGEYGYSEKKSKADFNRRKNFHRDNLRAKLEVIEKRLAELRSRGDRIDLLLSRIEQKSSAKLKEVSVKLLSARKIVISQFARYELQRDRIELFALQNKVSSVLQTFHRLNDEKTEKGLALVESSIEEIQIIKQEISRYLADETPADVVTERQNFLAQLVETEDSCEKLREALLSRQAARALQDISPIEENLQLPGAKEIVHAAESFNIQTTLTDFSESFEELEREYKRLRAEEETGRKLLDE